MSTRGSLTSQRFIEVDMRLADSLRERVRLCFFGRSKEAMAANGMAEVRHRLAPLANVASALHSSAFLIASADGEAYLLSGLSYPTKFDLRNRKELPVQRGLVSARCPANSS
jgi:hypothetical protein